MTEPLRSLDPRERYEELREQATLAIEEGRLDAAYELFDRSHELASQLGDDVLTDRAFCNRARIAIELRRGEDAIAGLRTILMGNRDAENSRLAGYNIAVAYRLKKANKKALFYARIALERSTKLGRRAWIASSHNEIGNILIADSYFDEACDAYAKALEHSDDMRPFWRAGVLTNLGYCRMVEKRRSEGFTLLYESARILARGGQSGVSRVVNHLDLCFAHLEVERFATAERHGQAGLRLAEHLEDAEHIKNALYLLGDLAMQKGDVDLARSYFDRLERYYPGHNFVTELLLTVDVSRMINLRA